MSYSDKLKDPRWQRKRLEVMQRDKFRCLVCGDDKSTLHVHHLAYHGDPWKTPLGMLETLCESCHEFRSETNKKLREMSTSDLSLLIHQADFMERHDKDLRLLRNLVGSGALSLVIINDPNGEPVVRMIGKVRPEDRRRVDRHTQWVIGALILRGMFHAPR